MLRIIFSALLFTTALCVGQNSSGRNFIYNTYKYDKQVNVFVNNTTEQIMDFIEENELWHGYPTRVHVSTNETLSMDNPVFVTATQQKGISSWEIPLIVQTQSGALLFSDMARTLCPHDAGPDIKTENRPMIQITTSNPKNVSVNIKLRRVTDFYVDVNKWLPLNATPSSPKYYFFSFDQHPWNVTNRGPMEMTPRFNYTIPKSVILMINSDDDVCATVSIQNNSCPVFDSEKEALYKGYHLTMMSKGGITLTQTMFPNGFYIVFIVKENDAECTGARDPPRRPLWDHNRLKTFRFRVIATISYREYVVGALVTLALVAVVALLVVVALVACTCRCTETVTIVEAEPIAQASTSGELTEPTEPSHASAAAEDARILDDTDDEPDEDEQWSRSHPLTVRKLTRAPPETFTRRSDRYFWGALTVAIVYALPVVQLLFTYQRMVYQTGDQDLCYYNFLCAHPLGFLADFNHVYSNVGYVLLGLVFLAQVRHRQLKNRGRPQGMGVPQHYGLLYSMGLGLVMEGLLSGCYHLCPNKMNFQFDSSFMYVIAVLVMIKLYQNRHSDIIPSAHTTFIVLAAIMTLGLFGILYPSVPFSVLFTILHMATCFILTLKIYYAGKFNLEVSAVSRGLRALRTRRGRALLPAHRARAALVAGANLANWAFAIYSAIVHNKDFARQLLAILMGNAILYTMFYIIMKLVHRERIAAYTWLYFVLAHVAWFSALKLFLDSKTKWSQTPAQSRRHNAECSILQLFDSHDAWHVTSAAAMFLSFNMLLTVDDLVADTHRDNLHTF